MIIVKRLVSMNYHHQSGISIILHNIMMRQRQQGLLKLSSIMSSSKVFMMSSSTTTSSQQHNYDVLIIGGGVVGLTLAKELQIKTIGLNIGLIEVGKGPQINTSTTDIKRIPNPRSYALSPASIDIIFGNNNNNNNDNNDNNYIINKGGYYDSMQVWEENQPASLLLNVKDLNDNNNNNNNNTNYLGCCIEDSILQEYLWKQIIHTNNNNNINNTSSSSSNVTIHTETTFNNIQWPSNNSNDCVVKGDLINNNNNNNTTPIQAKLVIAADGANSTIRKLSGITTQTYYDYGQTAITFTVKLNNNNNNNKQGRAYQRFLSTGPIALLPTYLNDYAVIVWSTTPNEAMKWKNEIDTTKLVQHLNNILQIGPQQLPKIFNNDTTNNNDPLSNISYGIQKVIDTIQYGTTMAGQQDVFNDDNGEVFCTPPIIDSIASTRFTFPLSCQIPTQYTMGTYLALIGDAAHTVHPMAGQGLNLGIQDIQSLINIIVKANSNGMDITTFINEYNTSRHKQVQVTVNGIHTLHNIFHHQQNNIISKHIKSFGINFIQNIPILRRIIVQTACYGIIPENNYYYTN